MGNKELIFNLDILKNTLAILGMTTFFNGRENVSIDRLIDEVSSILKIESSDDFLKFLFYTMNPNEMEHYIQMYNSNGEKTPGASKGGRVNGR